MRDSKIFLVDDEAAIVSLLAQTLKKEGYSTLSATNQFDTVVERIIAAMPDLVLLDIRLVEASGITVLENLKKASPGIPVIMLTADDTAETAVTCMKLGAADYLIKPFNIEEVKLVIRNVLEKEQLRQELSYLRTFYDEKFDRDLIGRSDAIRELRAQMEKIARSRVPSVLITGESGTGKELVARCLHRAMAGSSTMAYAPFIAVNCSAMPDTLLENELFGHEKGAFTDAKTDKKGIFELANKGTILLDEIGEMKLEVQSKLLRVLEERTVRRIGGQHERAVDVTVMATTNRDIPSAILQGEFRSDLFYRLNVFPVNVPPLRERRADILPIAEHYLEVFAARYRNKNMRTVSPEAAELLQAYDWPGNVRELKNVIERIVVLESDDMIRPQHLPRGILQTAVQLPVPKKFILPDEGISLDDLEKDLIVQALAKAKQNRTLAAKLLGITYDSLRYQIRKFGLET